MVKGYRRIRTAGCNLAAILACNIICFVRANSGNSCMANRIRIEQFWQQRRRNPLRIKQFWQQQRKNRSREGYFPFASAPGRSAGVKSRSFGAFSASEGGAMSSAGVKISSRRTLKCSGRGYFPSQEDIFLCGRRFPFAAGIFLRGEADRRFRPARALSLQCYDQA